MEMDRNLKKLGQFFHALMLCLLKSPKHLLWLALRDKIHLMSSSQFYRSILFIGKGTK